MRNAPRWTYNMRSAEWEGNEKSEPRDPDNCSSHGKEKKDARKHTQPCTNELCEILSSDDSNEQIEQETDNFIIVELISYIGGNSRIITYYPSTRGSKSGQNKYLHHFYSKKRIKLYLCLHKRSNEIYIYEVESRKVRRRETPPGSGADAAPISAAISAHGGEMTKASVFLHSEKVKSEPQCDTPLPPNGEHNPIVNESTSSCKEEPTHDCKSEKYKIKVEDKTKALLSENPNLRERTTKKMVIKKLFDSVHCSYDLSSIEFTKLNNPDDKTLNSLKSILEQKINKGERRTSDAGLSRGGTPPEETSQKGGIQKGDAPVDSSNVDTLSKGTPPSDPSCVKTDEAGKNVTRSGDNDNASDSQVKILFLHFREPADIYMNQFAAFNQGTAKRSYPRVVAKGEKLHMCQRNDETCTKEINGFLKDEQQQHLEEECAKAKRTNSFASQIKQIKQITHGQVPQSFLQSYESDVSIYSNDLYFSDTQIVTREDELDMNEKKKKNIPVLTRSHLKIKWLLLNLNLTKDEEVVIQKYVLSKKANILRFNKSTHDSNDLHSSFYKTKKKSNGDQRKSRREESPLLKRDTTANGKPYSTRSTRKGNSQPSQQNENKTERSDNNEAHHTQLTMNDRDENYQSENTIKDKLKGEENKLIFTFKFEDDAVKTRQAEDLQNEHVSVEDKMSSQGGEINMGNLNDDAAEVDPTVRESDASVEPVLYYHTDVHPTPHDVHSEFVSSTCQEPSRPSKVCSSYSYLDQGSQALFEPATDNNEEETQTSRKRKIDQVENANEMQHGGKKSLHVVSEREAYDDTFPEVRNSECEMVTPEVEATIGRCQAMDVSGTSNGASNEASNDTPNYVSNDTSNDTSNDSLASTSGQNHSGNSNVSYISETDPRYRQCGDSVEEILPREDGKQLQSELPEGQQLQGCASEAVNGSITLQCDGFVGSFGGCYDGEGFLKGDVCRADQEGVSGESGGSSGSGESGVSGDRPDGHPPGCHAERADETTQKSACKEGGEGGSGQNGQDRRDDQEAIFFKYKVRSLFDIIKVICCNFTRHFKYSSKLKFYIATFLNFSKIEKTKLQFMQKERIVDTHLLKIYINKKRKTLTTHGK